MKKLIKDKIKKEDIILFLGILIFAIIMNNAFLQRRYSSDTMCLLEHGYFEYPSHYFLLDGRIISTLVCYAGGILNLPVDTYLFILDLIGIIFLSVSVMVLYKFTVKYLNVENKIIKFLILVSIYTIIFNHLNIEYLLYPESGVMCAGLLFSILAAITYIKKPKLSLLKSFCWLLLATLCYQGLLSIFPTIVITLMLLKRREDNVKTTIIFYIKNILILGIMFVIVLGISYGLVNLFNILLSATSYRVERLQGIMYWLKALPTATYNTLIYQEGKIPKNISVIVMCMTTLFIIRYNPKLLLKYFIVVFTAYLFCMLPVIAYGYVTSRILMAIGGVMGISLLFMAAIVIDNQGDIFKDTTMLNLISVCIVAYFMFNVINNYNNSYWHLRAFQKDEEIGKQIAEVVREYEEKSGNEITKFSYYYDKYPIRYERGMKELGSLTERKFAMEWCIRESVGYYCNKQNLEYTGFLTKVYYKNFWNKDYN